jgi:tetratricopeptide (TPR) repeat protein
MATAVRVGPPLVGRVQELALLERHLAGSPEGSPPPVLLLAGQPGIGKSRLLSEAEQHALAHGWRVLAGGCTHRGGQQPFAPLLDALQRHLAGRSPGERRLDIRGCAWLVRLLPELADEEIEALPGWTVSAEQERRLLFEAVRRFLANVATPVGTLLLLDDLQWAGADALELLGSLVRQTAGAPLRVVGTYRDTDVAPEHPLTGLLAELAEAQLATLQPLRPLRHREAQTLFVQLLGEREQDRAPLAAQVVQRTGGVPFFLVSYARSLAGEGGADLARRGMPWDLRQSLQRRVQALSEAGRALVAAAAVSGRVTPRPLLLAALARPESEVIEALEQACRAGLLEEVGDDAYGFVHDVIREVVESDLGQARRRLLHRRTAEALEGICGGAPAEVLAYHYGRSDVPERAAGYLEQAGDQAQVQHGRAAAEGAYRDAVERLDRLGQRLDAARVREKLGALLMSSARYAEALAVLAPAAETHRAMDNLEATGRVVAAMADVHTERGTPVEGLALLEPVLTRLAMQGPSRALAALYAKQADLFYMLGRLRADLAATAQAEHIARQAGDDKHLGEALLLRGLALLELGRVVEAVQTEEAALPVLETEGSPYALCAAYWVMANAHQERGAFAAGRQATERALGLAERHGFRIYRALALVQRGRIAFLTGDWTAARGDFERATAIGREVGPFWGSILATLGLGMLCMAEGAEEAAHLLDECERQLQAGCYTAARLWATSLLAERDLLGGRADMARARLAPWLDPDGPHEEDVTPVLPLMAWAQCDLGEVDAAAELAARAVAQARQTGRQVVLVDALRVAALVAGRQGRQVEAEEALQEGLVLARHVSYPYGEARLLLVRGEQYARSDQQGPAREQLSAALAIFRRLGAQGRRAGRAAASPSFRYEAARHLRNR